MVYLQKAALTDGRDVYEMLQRIPPENGFLNSCYQMDWAEFPSWLAKRVNMAQGIGLEDWQVPSTTYWLMDDGIPVAFGSLRHRLTDALREAGIAYAIDQISELIAEGVDGIHLYTMNNPEVAKQIAGSISSIRAV